MLSCLADVADAEAVERMVSSAGQLDIIIACAAWSDRSGSIDEQELLSCAERSRSPRWAWSTSCARVCGRSRGDEGGRAGGRAGAGAAEPAASDIGGHGGGGIFRTVWQAGDRELHHGDSAAERPRDRLLNGQGCCHYLGRRLAAELLPHRINVNVVLPGWVDTPGERKWTADQTIASLGPQMPWGRRHAEDVGAAVGFLCCDAQTM